MCNLFVTRRNGKNVNLAVVCGTVVSVNGTTVTISGDVKLPCENLKKTHRVKAKYSPDILKRMSLKNGSTVIALVQSTPDIDMVFDGGESGYEEYDCVGKYIRYTGEFTFSEQENQKEEHVISGNVVSEKFGKTAQGDEWHSVAVSFGEKVRHIVIFNGAKEELVGRKGVFVTSAQNSKGVMTAKRYMCLQ